MSLFIVAYDIRHPGRRTRVAKVLLQYGVRLQQSVYEVVLEDGDRADMLRRVGAHLARDDELEVFPVDTRRPRSRIRWQRPPVEPQAVILA